MRLLFKCLWLAESASLSLGLIFNVLLIVVIYKCWTKEKHSYSYLMLASAFFDIVFSLAELATQHVSCNYILQ